MGPIVIIHIFMFGDRLIVFQEAHRMYVIYFISVYPNLFSTTDHFGKLTSPFYFFARWQEYTQNKNVYFYYYYY